MNRWLVTPVAVATALVFAASASAHAQVSPTIVPAKSGEVFTLAVPTEKENATTTKIEGINVAKSSSQSDTGRKPRNPHRWAAAPATIPADVRGQLDANMGTDKMGELSSNMKMNPGDAITVSFGKIKPGQYLYHCVPHLALGMKGVITVQ